MRERAEAHKDCWVVSFVGGVGRERHDGAIGQATMVAARRASAAGGGNTASSEWERERETESDSDFERVSAVIVQSSIFTTCSRTQSGPKRKEVGID